ncbi:MAG: ABC transporter permease [Dokdonella sp.]
MSDIETATNARSGKGVSLLRCYALEAKHEFLRLLRTPAFALPTLFFPPMFYVLFAVVFNKGGSNSMMPSYLLATYAVFGVMAPGLFGFGVGVALDRERGWLTLKRAQPMPAGCYLAAKLAMAMLFAALIFAIMATLAATLGGVRLPASSWATLLLIDMLGVLPFCAIGLLIGTLVSGQAAPAVANLIYLPMSFLAGLWMPMSVLPQLLRDVAPLWPAYHLGQIALSVVGQGDGSALLPHVAALIAVFAGFFFFARRRLATSA